jgi:hypothetical protein
MLHGRSVGAQPQWYCEQQRKPILPAAVVRGLGKLTQHDQSMVESPSRSHHVRMTPLQIAGHAVVLQLAALVAAMQASRLSVMPTAELQPT